MATGYQYRPLDQARQEIRLLCFEYGVEQAVEQPLSCTIKHISTLPDLGLLPEYYAVSHTWSDSKDVSTILVDGLEVNIPHDAEVALRYLHNHSSPAVQIFGTGSPFMAESPIAESPTGGTTAFELEWPATEVRLWMDVLCIDQSNPKEKSHQLLMISDIYSQAREVLIWLGEDTDGMAGQAVSSIYRTVEQCNHETNNLADLFDTVWAIRSSELSPKGSTGPLPMSCSLTALRSFYSARWFQRLWVLQESALATRATFRRGSHTIQFHDVVLAARWMWFRTFGRLFPGDNQYTNHTIGIQNASTMWDMISTPFIVPRVLSNLVLLGMRFETSDPRDKIYAILGLLNDEDFDCLPADLIPDYDVSLPQLYTRITRAIIEDTQSLFIMKVGSTLIPPAGHEEDEMELPSWVPRYDWIHDVNKGSPSAIRSMRRAASDDVKLSFRNLVGMPGVLAVEGLSIDQVSHLANAPWEPGEYDAETLKGQISATWTMTATHAKTDVCGSLEAAYAITICAGRNKWLQDVTEDKQFYVCCAAFFWTCGPSCKDLSEYFWGLRQKDNKLVMDNSEDFLAAIVQNSRNLRFFVTSGGRIGMGPREAQADDKVCIIPGCDVPVILRKEGPFWRYVGDAYVHGIMDGEYFRERKAAGSLRMQWFSIT